jgi:hypothetical protein
VQTQVRSVGLQAIDAPVEEAQLQQHEHASRSLAALNFNFTCGNDEGRGGLAREEKRL